MSSLPLPWNSAQPSSKAVQHAFTNARVSEINRNLSSLRAATVKALREDARLAPRIKGYSSAKKQAFAEDCYDHLTRVLQSRNLTINFKSTSWFSTENTYETYAQMYERGLKNGKMILDDSDPANPANIRVAADDRVTFPTAWSAPQAVVPRGQQGAVTLTPRGPAPQQIMGRMMAGRALTPQGSQGNVLNAVPATGGAPAGYESPNPRFDPKSKQVFTALDYGRRIGGACTFYGRSYLVLNHQLKTDAIFFPEDTFYAVGANLQVSYQTLGSIFLKAKDSMRALLISSCLDNIHLSETNSPAELMEAHVFQPLRFGGGVSHMVLEPSAPAVEANAKKFCTKWGIKMMAGS